MRKMHIFKHEPRVSDFNYLTLSIYNIVAQIQYTFLSMVNTTAMRKYNPNYVHIQKIGKPVENNELLGKDFHHNCIAIYFKSTMQVDFAHFFFYIFMMLIKYCRSLTMYEYFMSIFLFCYQ